MTNSLKDNQEKFKKLKNHIQSLYRCRRCKKMYPAPVSGGPVVSKVLLVGQAPGDKEPKLGRPFAWTAGKTLFGWFEQTAQVNEDKFRRSIYMAAVCRCFPGKIAQGGDRVPLPQEIANCSLWLKDELNILQPDLIIAVGKLAISQFIALEKLDQIIGKKFVATKEGHIFDLIPLPHPSGASPWHRKEPGKSLLKQALKLIVKHPAFNSAIRGR